MFPSLIARNYWKTTSVAKFVTGERANGDACFMLYRHRGSPHPAHPLQFDNARGMDNLPFAIIRNSDNHGETTHPFLIEILPEISVGTEFSRRKVFFFFLFLMFPRRRGVRLVKNSEWRAENRRQRRSDPDREVAEEESTYIILHLSQAGEDGVVKNDRYRIGIFFRKFPPDFFHYYPDRPSDRLIKLVRDRRVGFLTSYGIYSLFGRIGRSIGTRR